MKNGRPSKFDSINLEQVKKLVLKGFTDKEISDFFDINEGTFHNWKKANEEFFKALKNWKMEADDKVERSLYERALGYSHKAVKMFVIGGKVVSEEYTEHYPPDATSAIFWLKNRKPQEWREKNETELNINFTAKTIMDAVQEASKQANRIKEHV